MPVVQPWTMLEIRRLLELRTQRYSLSGIARRMPGRTQAAVARKLSYLGATERQEDRRKRSQFRKAVKRLCRPGRSDQDVAQVLGVTSQQVCRARKALGIPAGVGKGRKPGPQRRPAAPLPECWSCDRRAPRCGGSMSLAARGWYSQRAPSLSMNEVYCPDCVRRYGTPDQWALRAPARAV